MNNLNQGLLTGVLIVALAVGVAFAVDKYYVNCGTMPFLNKTVCIAGNK